MSAELDGELTQDERNILSEHIKTCADCKALYEHFTNLSTIMREELPLPLGFNERVMDAIKNEQPRSAKVTRFPKRIVGTVVAVAACAALVFSSGTWRDFTQGGINDASTGAGTPYSAVSGSGSSVTTKVADVEGSSAEITAMEATPMDVSPMDAESMDDAPADGSVSRFTTAPTVSATLDTGAGLVAASSNDIFSYSKSSDSTISVRIFSNVGEIVITNSDDLVHIISLLAFSAESDLLLERDPELIFSLESADGSAQEISVWISKGEGVHAMGNDGLLYIPLGDTDSFMTYVN